MLTILAQDPIGGLELCTRSGEWVAAPYIEGTLVVNLGDMVKVWTNDIYVSNPHRVANRTGQGALFDPDLLQPRLRHAGGLPAAVPVRRTIRRNMRRSSRATTWSTASRQVQKYKTPAELAAG